MSLNLYQTLIKFEKNIEQFLRTYPSRHYKVYKIPKRTIGFRIIAQPTPRVKAVQRVIVNHLRLFTRIHDCAFAYRPALSIKQNAEQHKNSDYLLKIDIKNFFNSLTPKILFDSLMKQGVELSPSDKTVLAEFAFWNRTKKSKGNYVLSVGASSSPYISNTIMYNFDITISAYCKECGVTYTRYADDLTFSTKHKNILPVIYRFVRNSLYEEFKGRLVLNEEKTIFSSKGNNRHVTGLVLTNNNAVSIGRSKKRYISALVHKFSLGQLDYYDSQNLKGLLSFARYIEPDFYERLKRKYGVVALKTLSTLSDDDNDE